MEQDTLSAEEILEFSKLKRKKDQITYEKLTKEERDRYIYLRKIEKKENVKKSVSSVATVDYNPAPGLLFFALSLFIAWAILSLGTFEFSWWFIPMVPLFAIWLMVPIISGNYKSFSEAIVFYIIWVLIQWCIFYFQIGPPDWARGRIDY